MFKYHKTKVHWRQGDLVNYKDLPALFVSYRMTSKGLNPFKEKILVTLYMLPSNGHEHGVPLDMIKPVIPYEGPITEEIIVANRVFVKLNEDNDLYDYFEPIPGFITLSP